MAYKNNTNSLHGWHTCSVGTWGGGVGYVSCRVMDYISSVRLLANEHKSGTTRRIVTYPDMCMHNPMSTVNNVNEIMWEGVDSRAVYGS